MEQSAGDSSQTLRLLELARDGQTEAREQLFARHRRYLHRVIDLRLDSRLRARIDSSDIVQDAQAEAARRWDAYLENPRMPFRLWLRRIAYDRLLMARRMHVRSSRRTVERDLPLPEETSLQLSRRLLASGSSPSQRMLRGELVRRVSEAMARLSEADREVLLMRNVEGLSNQEMAQFLQIDAATASKRYGRAVLHLRVLLMKSGITGSQP